VIDSSSAMNDAIAGVDLLEQVARRRIERVVESNTQTRSAGSASRGSRSAGAAAVIVAPTG